MDEIIEGLIEKTGISKEQAEAVLTFLKENGPKVTELLGSDAVAGVAEGLSDADIAKAMKVSYSRTRQLLAAAFGKLGLKSRNDFIRFLWERGGRTAD